MIKQDMIIYRLVSPFDNEILDGKNAKFIEGDAEIYALDRACAVEELNKHGIRVLQFIWQPDSCLTGEWVLIERVP